MGFPILTELAPQGAKLIKYMSAKGYPVQALNIVYVEGINTDLVTVNNDKLDQWNDVRCIISNQGDVLMAATATTEPGAYYTYNRMNPLGAFRIAFGYHQDAWAIGKHFKQDALVQVGNISGYRDANEDGSRAGDKLYVGSEYGVNQHTTGNSADAGPPDLVGKWSAGCLVGRYASTHYNKFLPICRAMGKKLFSTTVIDGTDLSKFK